MEITIDTILNVAGLIFGGGALGGLLTWRFTRRKAMADAESTEAEAEAKKAEAEQERQNYYQQIIDDISKDRDYYKQERDELRGKLDNVFDELRKLKKTGEEERASLRTTIDTLTRRVDSMIPYLCFNKECLKRITSENTDKCPKREKKQEQTEEPPIEGIEPGAGNVF